MTSFRNFLGYELSPALKQDFAFRSMIYLVVYFLFIMPIIRVNYFYIDDLGRSLHGYTKWGAVGRPFASFVMEAINFNRWTITDLAPLPQILAVIFLSMASAWTSIFYRLRSGFGILPVAFVVCNPFFLENLSYRFDSFTMAIAVCLAMLPFGLALLFSGVPLYCGTFFAVFLSLNFYQPALNVFIVLAFFSAIIDVKDLNVAKSAHVLFFRLLCLVAALIIYKSEEFLFPFGRYASKHAGLAPYKLSIFLQNFKNGSYFLAHTLLHTHQTQILLCAMLLGIFSFFIGLYRKKSRRRKTVFALSAITSMVFLMGMLEGVVGPIILLRSPIWASRVMIGFGAFSACLLSFIVLEFQQTVFNKYVSVMLCLVLFAQFTISYAYGNALHAQDLLDRQLASNIAEDAYILSKGSSSSLMVHGIEPTALNARLTTEYYPVVKALLPLPLHGGWMWGGVLLQLHGLPSNIKFIDNAMPNAEASRILAKCQVHAMIKNLYYYIYKNGPYLIVDFDKRCSQAKTS